jgi:hypothetical protein
MAHVISREGTPIAIGDGLGVPIDRWQPGDTIIQRHPLRIPPATPEGEYVVYTGGYWLDNMERWIWKINRPQDRSKIHLSKVTVPCSAPQKLDHVLSENDVQ